MITQMGTIKIEIQRRKIKNMNIYIKPPKGDVLVTVPMRISDEEVFRFLKKKEQWILKNHEKMKNQKIGFLLNRLRMYLQKNTISILRMGRGC